MMGGRTAEEIAIGDITTGAENDLLEATRLARRMVTRWGMSEIGLAAFDMNEEQPFLGYEISQGRPYSESTAAHIDKVVQTLLADRHQTAHTLLVQHREKLDDLVTALLKKETIDETGLVAILGKRPLSTNSDPSPVDTGGEKDSEEAQKRSPELEPTIGS